MYPSIRIILLAKNLIWKFTLQFNIRVEWLLFVLFQNKNSICHCFKKIFYLSCFKTIFYQWTDFRRKQNNPHKRTLISMFCWFDFFLFYFSCLLDQTPSSVYRKPKFMKIREKLRVLLASLFSIFYLRNPVLKENYDR